MDGMGKNTIIKCINIIQTKHRRNLHQQKTCFWLESTSTETIAGSNQHPRFNHSGNEGKLSWHAPSSIAMLDFWRVTFPANGCWERKISDSVYVIFEQNSAKSELKLTFCCWLRIQMTNTTKPNKHFNIRQHVQWCRCKWFSPFWGLLSYSCLVDFYRF